MSKRNEVGPTSSPVPSVGIRTRQLYLALSIVALAVWMALPFLTPIGWAAVLAIAEWPLFKWVERLLPRRPYLLAFMFTVATALLLILPLSIAAVVVAQESQSALNWLQHVQHDGLPTPHWVQGLPLVGGRISSWWQSNLASPQGTNALLGTVTAGSALGWTRSIASEVARESALFLLTLIVLSTLLARGNNIAKQTEIFAARMFGMFGRDFASHLTGAVRSTVIGTLLVSFAEGAIIGVAYAVAGVPQPLLFATFTILLA